jgi:hypothetical protein
LNLHFFRGSSKYGAHLAFNNDELQIEDIPGKNNLLTMLNSSLDTDKHGFQLTTPQKSFVVFAPNRKEKLDWMLAIMNASEEWKIKKDSFGNRDEEYVLAAPVWIPGSHYDKIFLYNSINRQPSQQLRNLSRSI